MPYCYTAFGLNICAELPLPGLAEAEGAGDVVIRYGDVLGRTATPPRSGGCFEADSGHIFAYYERAGAFLVRDGQEIIVEPSDESEEAFLHTLLTGPCLSLLLHQRGILTLHASAVALGGAAVAFVGDKGWGKSTTVATLHRRGHPLVTDDVLAIRFGEGTLPAPEAPVHAAPVALPGLVQIKLWPDAVRTSLGHSPEELPRVYEQYDKRTWRADLNVVARTHLPLGILYVLGIGARFAAEPLPPRAAFAEILRNTFTGAVARPTGTAPRHVRQCTALVQHVPIFRLERPRSLAALPDLARFIEEHAAQTLQRICP